MKRTPSRAWPSRLTIAMLAVPAIHCSTAHPVIDTPTPGELPPATRPLTTADTENDSSAEDRATDAEDSAADGSLTASSAEQAPETPACLALGSAATGVRAALIEEVKVLHETLPTEEGERAAAELLDSLKSGNALPRDYSYSGNTALGIVSLEKERFTMPLDTPFAQENAPRRALHGCWGLVRTGLQKVAFDKLQEVIHVTYAYSVAFAGVAGNVVLRPVPTYWDGVDAYNVLAVADLDGDGWEEAIYQAVNGWEGQGHDSLEGNVTLLLTSKDERLEAVPPFDSAQHQALHWRMEDVNDDGRVDLTAERGWDRTQFCEHHRDPTWGDPPFVSNRLTLAQGVDGDFSFQNQESLAIAKQRCKENPPVLNSSEDVICARIWGECSTDLRRRIRAAHAPWNCTLDAQGQEQATARANLEFFDMLNTASSVPPISLAPLCRW